MSAAGMLAAQMDREWRLGEVAAEIERRAGLGNWAARGTFLSDKVRQRTKARGLATEGEYIDWLLGQRDAAEWDALVEAITIGETSFWRYAAQWRALRDIILPDLAVRRPNERIRIWCAGSSNGAEPYTLSILLRQDPPEGVDADQVDILATDISRARLAQASRGVYSDWDLRSLSAPLRDACFIADGSRWRLRDEYKRGVEFRQHNLADFVDETDPAERCGFDVVMCRNVLIYFEMDLVRRLLRRFHACVADDGWFLSGHAESYLEIANVFVPVPAHGTTLYRKQAVSRATQAPIEEMPTAPLPQPPALRAPAERPFPAVAPAAPRHRVAPAPMRPRDAQSPTDKASRPHEAGIEALRSLANRGAWPEAAALGARLAERDGIDPELHFLISLSCAHMGDPEGADTALRRALYLDPDFALAHYHLGMVAISRQRAGEAARSFRNVLASLQDIDDEVPIRAGDGVTAGDLRQYACLQIGQHPEARK